MGVVLNGMTWNHSRAYPPLVAVSQRFEELHPDVKIQWEKRSLADFENYPVEELAEKYDFIILDHPWTGFIISSDAIWFAEELFPAEMLDHLSKNSIGASYESYTMNGHQIALPIDGATPIAAYRADVLAAGGDAVPVTWGALMDLARRGKVIVAGSRLYTFLDFLMMCATIVEKKSDLYLPDLIAPMDVQREALESYRELLVLCPARIYEMDPIAVYEEMSRVETPYAYCPFIYGYVNYFRPGYGSKILSPADVVLYKGRMLRTTLGGTGLAISKKCRALKEAVEFSEYAMSETIQNTVYPDAGGQPGLRSAWINPEVNRRSNDFYAATIKTMENAAVRPRYDGYYRLQNNGGTILRDYLVTGRGLEKTLEELNHLYRISRNNGPV